MCITRRGSYTYKESVMFITKKAIPRRTFLRGAGATLALPLLDSMIPAFARPAYPVTRPVARISLVYVPFGSIRNQWMPETEGAGYDLSPTLHPLSPYR